MKNVLLLGATGTAGSALTKKLLSDTDCHLTLFSRHAGEVYSDTPRTKVISGDAENVEEIKAALCGQNVVYCAIVRHTHIDRAAVTVCKSNDLLFDVI